MAVCSFPRNLLNLMVTLDICLLIRQSTRDDRMIYAYRSVGLRSGAKIGSWISYTFPAWRQVSIVLHHFRLKQPTDWKFGVASI